MLKAAKAFGDQLVTWFERVWPLVRPTAHTRIAWVVTIAGLSIVAGPFWEPVAIALAERLLHRSLPQAPDLGWGLALVTLALAYHLLAVRADGLRAEMASARIRAHDAPLVNAFVSAFPEGPLLYALSNLSNDHSINSSETQQLDSMPVHLQAPRNHLLDVPLREGAEALADASYRLARFIGANFFTVGTGPNFRLVMHPQWNFDRATGRMPTAADERSYEAATTELNSRVDAVEAAYSAFVRLAHERVL